MNWVKTLYLGGRRDRTKENKCRTPLNKEVNQSIAQVAKKF